MRNKALLMLITALVMVQAGCGGNPVSSVVAPADTEAVSTLLPSLGDLAQRRVSVTGAVLNGAQYSGLLPSQAATVSDTSCLLVGSGTAADTIAYAIYDFSLPDYSGPGELQLELATGNEDVLLGFSNFGSGRWQFQQTAATASQSIAFGEPSQLFAADGRFLVAVLAVGVLTVQIDSLQIGTPSGNMKPQALLSVDNIFGEAPFTVSYDSADSSDPDGSITLYELDLDNDSIYEISEVTAPSGSFEVTEEGSYPLQLRVTDDGGASTVAKVIVNAGAGWQDSGASFPFMSYNAGHLDFDADGLPLVMQWNTDYGLSYAKALDPLGQNWPEESVLIDDNGQMGHMTYALINGNPAVAYSMDIDESNKTELEFRFVRAQNAAGTAWSAPANIPITEYPQQVLSLAEVDGHPAVLLEQFVTGEDSAFHYYYSRASDAQGTAWSTPVLISELDVVGDAASNLFVYDGIPFVAIAHSPSGLPDDELLICRANDGQGNSWAADEYVAQIEIGLGARPVLMELNDLLTIGHGDIQEVSLYQATDATATTWTNIKTFPVGAYVANLSYHDSFGHPALSWSTLVPYTESKVQYVRALDSAGSSWPTPGTVTSTTTSVSSYTYGIAQTGVLGGLPAAFTYHPSDPLKLSRYQ
jgi:hypothetical protein